MDAVLVGLTSGELLTPNAPYRATWARRTAAIAAAEVVTVGGAKTTQADLAAALDEQLAATVFFRGSPLSYGPVVITWDLVGRSTAARTTAAQAARSLDGASAYLRLERLEPRVRVSGQPQREADRAATESTAAAVVAARRGPFDALLGGLKAFGVLSLVVAGGVLLGYLVLTRRATS